MKHFRNLFYLSALALLCSISSCGDNDVMEFPSEPNTDLIKTLAQSSESMTYQSTRYRRFDMPAGSNEWKEMDLNNYDGWESSGPESITFNNGKIWTPLSLFSYSTGPSLFHTVWSAYLKATNKKEKLYVCADFNFDTNTNQVNIGGRKYTSKKFESDEIVLSHVSDYAGGQNGNGGKFMEYIYYTPAKAVAIDSETDKGFKSAIDAYDYIMQCAHTEFGDTIDLNKVYSPAVIFDENIVDLKIVDDYLERIKGK